MENSFLTANQGLEGMFEQAEERIRKFSRKTYGAAFQAFYEEKQDVLKALEYGYCNSKEKSIYLSLMGDALIRGAAAHIVGVKKRAVENERINLNLMMVAYIFPAILQFQGTCAEPFVEVLLAKWKAQFPESNISAGTYEDIEGGFHKNWCYITTAVCQNSGKSDDCYELTLLREYRDGYLRSSEHGEELIQEYYDVAPTIVKRIEKGQDKDAVYDDIYKQYLQPCISMIENKRLAECKELYCRMVRDLQEIYFYTH